MIPLMEQLQNMLKTQLLQKIDTCLKCYVSENNTRYKRSIHTIFMDRNQLKNFYYDMQEEKQISKLDEAMKKTGTIRKSKSCFIKENKVMDWKTVGKVEINQRPLISNSKEIKIRKNLDLNAESLKLRVTHENRNHRFDYEIPMVENLQFFSSTRQEQPQPQLNSTFNPIEPSNDLKTPLQQQFDLEQIDLIKKEEEQKYINRHRLKQGKKQFKIGKEDKREVMLDRNELQNIKNQQKINRKLNNCFERFVEFVNEDGNREDNRETNYIRQQRKKKDQIANVIRNYFVKNNRNPKLKGSSIGKNRIF